MPRLKHFYAQNHLHYLTANTYRKARIFDSDRYMHNNPVKRGLVAQPGDWPWSSWRYCYLDDSSVLAMDRLP